MDVAGDADALFYIGLDLPDAWYLPVDAEDDTGERTLWILADDRKSWAAADYVPGEGAFLIGQFGPRSPWDEVEGSYEVWTSRGRPSRDRAGLTITKAGQRVWLDTPDNVIGRLPLADRGDILAVRAPHEASSPENQRSSGHQRQHQQGKPRC